MSKLIAFIIGLVAVVLIGVALLVVTSPSEEPLTFDAVASAEGDPIELAPDEPRPGQTETIFDRERFVALASDGEQWSLRSSVDGVTWNQTPVTGITPETRVFALQASGDQLVGIARTFDDAGTSTDNIVISQDGVDWVLHDLNLAGSPETDLHLGSITVLDGEFLATGPDSASDGDLTTVYRGPLLGPIEPVGTIATTGGVQRLVATETGLFASIGEFSETSDEVLHTVYASHDGGVTWRNSVSTPVSDGAMLTQISEVLLLVQYRPEGPTNLVSTDEGESWQPSLFDSGLFSPQTRFVSGDAGVVALTIGATEEVPVREVPENPTLTVDGFTLTLPMFGGDTIVTGPDGEVIHSISEGDLFSEDNSLVRNDPVTGDLTFADPDTGDDLVTFTELAIQERQQQAGDQLAELNADFVDPERDRRLHFSTDGLIWSEVDSATLPPFGPDSEFRIFAVGDNEVLISTDPYQDGLPELTRVELNPSS